MKKIFKFAFLLMAAGTLSMGFSSCSSDDDDNKGNTVEEQNNALKEMTGKYLSDVVNPTYTNLANETERLYQLITALNTKLQAGSTVAQSDIDAICTSYKNARKYWEQSEAFLYGAASDFEIDPHIDTWPLDVPTLANDLSDDKKIESLKGAAVNGRARDFLTSENLGFHGIEFIFFRNGKNRSVDIFNNDATEDDENFKGLAVTGLEEVIFSESVVSVGSSACSVISLYASYVRIRHLRFLSVLKHGQPPVHTAQFAFQFAEDFLLSAAYLHLRHTEFFGGFGLRHMLVVPQLNDFSVAAVQRVYNIP